MRSEEEPEPDEEPTPSPASEPAGTLVPSVPASGDRAFEYRTELLTLAQVADGKTLGDLLTKASTDGWDLVDVIGAGDKHAVLLRKRKETPKETRPVGFAPPGR